MLNKVLSTVDPAELAGKIVAFDLDGTLLSGDLGEALFYLAIGLTGIPQDQILVEIEKILSNGEMTLKPESAETGLLTRYQNLILNKQWHEAYCLTAAWLNALPCSTVDDMLDFLLNAGLPRTEVLADCGAGSHSLILEAVDDPDMREIIEKCLAAKANVAIVSASPQFVVEEYCQHYGYRTISAFGAAIKENGVCDLPFGSGKCTRIMEHFGASPFMAFGNSDGDYEMLVSAKHAFVRQTDSEKLLRKVASGDWIMLD